MLKHTLPLFETRATSQGVIEGYASTFGGIDSYGDTIQPGAFATSLESGKMPLMLWMHDRNAPIGRWLEMREDSRGLYATGQLNMETTKGREAYAHLRDRDISGMSIGYQLPAGAVDIQDGVRVLKSIDLIEVSIVSMPADDRARVLTVKHGKPGTLRELQHALQEMGFSRREAASIAQKGFDGLADESSEINEALNRIQAITKLF